MATLNATSLRSSGNLYSVGGDEVFLTPGSIQFNGSNQYLSFPSTGLTLSGANWTMEAYIYLTAYSAGFTGIYASCIFGAVNTSNQGFSLYLAGTISSYTSINAFGQVNIGASYNFSLNTWYHVAVTHTAAGVWLIYINGIALSTTNITAAGWSTITPYTIGYARPMYQYYFPGYISNFRLTIGTLLYTSNFTPPAAPLLSGANTSVLLNTSYGTTASFLDSSNNNLTITRVSSPTSSNVNPFTINTVQRILNSGLMQLNGVLDEVFMVPGSLQFNGVNQYLTIANSSTTIIGSNNFTLECWAYQASKASTYPLIFGNYNSSFVANTWGIFFNRTDAPNGFVLNAFNGSLFLNTGSTNVSNGWNHIAFVRNANTINCFVNGIQSSNTATYTSSIDGRIQSSIYVADAGGKDSPTFFNGNITNLRLTIGSSLYNSNFTLPIAPLLPDANTELLLNTPYNIGNTATFSDSSVNNLTVTQSNNVVSVASSPFTNSTGSIAFNGGSTFLTVPANAGLVLGANNFTVESWIYHNGAAPGGGVTNDNTIIGQFTASPACTFFLQNTNLAPCLYDGTTQFTSTTTLSANTWTHVAWVRNNNVLSIYVNGANTTLSSASLTTNFTGNTVMNIGRAEAVNLRYFNGYLTNLRVVNGTAVYTSNFTPPTTSLTAIANTILLLNATSSSNYTTDSGLNNLTITNGNTTYSISSPLPYNIYTASRLLSTGTLQLGGYFDEVTSF